MKKLLVIKSSVNSIENSVSERVYNAFIKEYSMKNSTDSVEILDLNTESLEAMTAQNFNKFYNEKADKYIEQLKSVDKLVVLAPMYNFNIPATLKIYIDMICQADKTFTYKYAGKDRSKGLLGNLKVEIISSQGAPSDWYPWGATSNYLTELFKFLGAQVHGSITYFGSKVAGFNINEVDYTKLVKKDAISF